MKLFITGGSGFIGRNLREQLPRKYDISAPSSSELDLLNYDRVSDFIKRNQFDTVIHTATWNATVNSKKDVSKVLANNLRMFYNLARCSKDFGKMIYFGSGAEYDRYHWQPKMKEEYFDTYIPSDDYGFSKYIMHKYAEKSGNIYDLCIFGVFGRYEDWEIRFISNACCKAVWGLPITIKQNVYFDYLYVDDLVRITEWFINNNAKERVYNVCTGIVHDLLTLAANVRTVSGKQLDIRIRNEGLGNEYSGNNIKLLNEIGNYDFCHISNAIQKLYEWYEAHKNETDRNNLLIDK